MANHPADPALARGVEEARKSARLPDGSVWPVGAERIGDIAGRLHHAGDYDAAEIVAAYLHLLAHPAGVESAVAKVRMVRRVERGNLAPGSRS